MSVTRATSLLLCALGMGCGGASADPDDPLAPETLRVLAAAQGSGTGSVRQGSAVLTLELESCDCPTLSLEEAGESVDLCALASLPALPVQLREGAGSLTLSPPEPAELGMLSGAIEADGSFIIAGTHDASTALGRVEFHRRFDGRFDASHNVLGGWAGQRVIADLPGQRVDCRALFSFALD